MPTPAARRPVIDHLIDRPCRQQRPPMSLVSGLATALTPRRILASLGRSPGRIRARRTRGVPRVAGQLTLELLDTPLQLLDTAIHRQQHFDYGLTPRVIDRLRLSTLHIQIFDEAELCPPGTERLHKSRAQQGFSMRPSGLEPPRGN